MPGEIIVIDAPAEEHDTVLLDTVAAWAEDGPVSFLRANKPDWRLEVTRHGAGPLDAEEADAIADSTLVLEMLRRERDGRPIGPRREIVLTAMHLVERRLSLSQDECRLWHREGYAWAVRLGRWDETGLAALEARFVGMRGAIDALLSRPADPRVDARWSRVARPPGPSEKAIAAATTLLSTHANRLGVFAEAEAILHFFMYRRSGGTRLPESA